MITAAAIPPTCRRKRGQYTTRSQRITGNRQKVISWVCNWTSSKNPSNTACRLALPAGSSRIRRSIQRDSRDSKATRSILLRQLYREPSKASVVKSHIPPAIMPAGPEPIHSRTKSATAGAIINTSRMKKGSSKKGPNRRYRS